MKALLNIISSAKLALVLVVLVILFAVAGALLPQEGLHDSHQIDRWQKDHATLFAIFNPLGLFGVFHSIPFFITIVLLAVNTFTCTLSKVIKDGGLASFKGPDGLKNSGFLVIHLTLLILMAGGFTSAALRMDGFIILTEGQTFRETHQSYVRLNEGPLRRERHKGFDLHLKWVETVFHEAEARFPVDVTSYIQIRDEGRGVLPIDGEIKINFPFSYRGVDITQDETGYSPRLSIREISSGRELLHSFAALKTFRSSGGREYRDYLPLSHISQQGQRVVVTLLPSFTRERKGPVKTGDVPNNPLLLVELLDEMDQRVAIVEIPFQGTGRLGPYKIGFTGLRRWSSFRVVEDPGYSIVWIALWLGVIGIILRYVGDLRGWTTSPPHHHAAAPACRTRGVSDV